MIHIISAVLKHDKAWSIWVSLKDSMTPALWMPQRFDHWLYLFATLFGQIHVMGDLMYRVLVSSYGNEWSTIKLKSMCIYICIYPIIIPLLLALPPWLLVNYSPTICLWYIHIYSLFINCQSLNPILLSLCSLIPSSVGPPHKINPPKSFPLIQQISPSNRVFH